MLIPNKRVCVCLCSANISITKLLDWRWTCYWKWLFSWWRKRKLTSSCCCAWKCGLKQEHGVFSASLFNPSKWLTGWHEWFTTTETSSENRQNRSCRRVSVSLCWAQWASPPPPRDLRGNAQQQIQRTATNYICHYENNCGYEPQKWGEMWPAEVWERSSGGGGRLQRLVNWTVRMIQQTWW